MPLTAHPAAPGPARQDGATVWLLVGHGSRHPKSRAELERLFGLFAASRPQGRALKAVIELEEPLLAEGLAQAAGRALELAQAGDLAQAGASARVVVAPLFLGAAGHVKNDLALALSRAREAWPQVAFFTGPELGVHPALTQLAWRRVAQAAGDWVAPPLAAQTLLLVVGRGSSDPDANGQFYRAARLVGEGHGLMGVHPAFMGITTPLVEEALRMAALLRPARLVVAPYLLFHGVLLDRLAEQLARFEQANPWIQVRLAAHLGPDESLLPLLEERAEQALSGRGPGACDHCQYRAALPGLARQVGGAEALLYSVRHSYAHQIETPGHAHPPIQRHVLVCGNIDCAGRGGAGLASALRQRLKEKSQSRRVLVTQTACLGRCGEGPSLAVYPDGVWYKGVGLADLDELVESHLLGGRPVARLVDQIL